VFERMLLRINPHPDNQLVNNSQNFG
jgi:hypothetical protein